MSYWMLAIVWIIALAGLGASIGIVIRQSGGRR